MWKLKAAEPSWDSILWSGVTHEKLLTAWMKTLMDVEVLRKIYVPRTQDILDIENIRQIVSKQSLDALKSLEWNETSNEIFEAAKKLDPAPFHVNKK